ncbi:MAG: 50S ribosomal protein L3 [Phycisphaeraceae bacterium]|jgi:large subunit ribosomal protein L3|nr:50S ribosomal protein L3 [Phycisphaeraceae bacterium]
MPFTLLGTKLGMTRVYTPKGVSVPVTVIQLGPCVVTQLRTMEKDGYTAVQLGFGEAKPSRSTIPVMVHDSKAGTTPKRYHREFRCTAEELAKFTLGQTLTVKDFEGTMFVDVTGTSKGKGFQGVMKRHNFKGVCASHGTERKHRSPGSIGGLCSNRGFGGGLKKGKRMAGHMGDERVTIRSLDIVRIDEGKGLLLVKGPVPGGARQMVMVRTSTRLYKSKAKRLAGGKK